jgi:hypothetical protein
MRFDQVGVFRYHLEASMIPQRYTYEDMSLPAAPGGCIKSES